MVMGEAGTAMAAQSAKGITAIASEAKSSGSVTNGSASNAASESTDEEAQLAAYAGGYVSSSSNGDVNYSIWGWAKKVEIYINGSKVKTLSYSEEQNVDYSDSFTGVAGGKYTIKAVVYDEDGVKSTSDIGTTEVSSSKISSITASSSVRNSGKGYYMAGSVQICIEYSNLNSSLHTKYEVYRSVKKNSGYEKIYSGETGDTYTEYYYDNTAKIGKTYYYKIKMIRESGAYLKSSKVIQTSNISKVKVEANPRIGYVSTYSNIDMDGNLEGICVSFSADGAANRFDIYRSTNRGSGYKKLKTVYTTSYIDKNVRRGKTYYYKVVPKYYDKNSGKVISGKISESVGARYIMSSAAPILEQASKTSIKVDWYEGVQSTSGVVYEIWYKRGDVSSSVYKKATTVKAQGGKYMTQNHTYMLRGLAPSGSYDVKIRTVKKSAGVEKYEETNTSSLTMGYTESVVVMGAELRKTSLTGGNKTLVQYYRLSWQKDWGASGYIISAYNNYTGKDEIIKRIKSGKTTSYTFRNVSTKSKGVKYSNVYVTPYKGKATGDKAECSGINMLASSARIKAVKKSGKAVKITWAAVKGASSYEVYRTSALGVSDLLGTTSKTYMLDTQVTTTLGYSYYVVAQSNFSGISSSSSMMTDEYKHTLSVPSIKSVKNSSSKKAVLTWNSVENAKYYVVYRSTSKKGTYKRVGSTTSETLTYTDKKLKKGKTYYYKIVATTVSDIGVNSRSKASTAKSVRITK